METKLRKAKIFGEYLGCIVVNEEVNGSKLKVLTIDNIAECVNGDWKLKLVSIWDMPEILIGAVYERERQARRLHDALYPQPDGHKWKISQESKHNKDDNNRFMISYMRINEEQPTKREGYMEGISDWFCIKNTLSVAHLKSLGFDLGSFWNYEKNLSGTDYAI